MSSWFNDAWAYVVSCTADFDTRSVLSFLGQKLVEGLFQAIAVVVIGWLVVYRQWRQLTQGKSDQVIFSANLFTPLDRDKIRRRRMERDIFSSSEPCWPPRRSTSFWTMWHFASSCAAWPNRPPWRIPILATEGAAGFEIVNDIVNCVSGRLASSPFRRDQWLMAVTCEGPEGRAEMLYPRTPRAPRTSSVWHRGSGAAGTSWSRRGITTGESSHSISWQLRFQEEQRRQERGSAQDIQANRLPLVDRQAHHPRIRILSLGLNVDEPIIKTPLQVDWERYLPRIRGAGSQASRCDRCGGRPIRTQS